MTIEAADSVGERQRALTTALALFQKAPPEPIDLDTVSSENPGWYNPTNRQALKDFASKYPLAEDLKRRFPEWSKSANIDADIHMLKLGRSAYPTWEELGNQAPPLPEQEHRGR